MPAVEPDDLKSYIGADINYDRAEFLIGIVTALAASYTRGEGFTAGEPQPDLRAVILSATARLVRDRGVASESMGPFSVQYRAGFDAGWSVAELAVLNRYRQRAK